MKKIYAVNSGCYSDYHINAIFTTRKLAEDFIKFVPDDDYNEIEEYELNPPTVDMVKRGYNIWRVHMLRDGTTERIDKHEINSRNVNSIGHNIWCRTQAPAYKGSEVPDILVSNVWAKTSKQAVKIVNEQRTQMIASGEWEK